MSFPYLLMTFLYFLMAVLSAIDASLSGFSLLPWFNGLRWLRVHFITLGVLTEALFGLLPVLVALRAGRTRPKFRWDIWMTLNAGLLVLLVGIPLINRTLIFTGGTLIFIAVLLLGRQLYEMRAAAPDAAPQPENATDPRAGRKFYLMGLAYFLVGILVGTGLWLGWSDALRVHTPIEVHIHANNWGLLSMLFAGLLIDLYPRFTGRQLAWPRSITPIFWLMTLGALGLVVGPWISSQYFIVPGLVLHLAATVWLWLNFVLPIWRARTPWSPGMLHMALSYAWMLAPVLVAPLILLGVPGFPGAGIEQNAPQALIYGWALQFGYALVPFLFRQAFLPQEEARLGGSTFSLVTVNLGSAFLWASIFIKPYAGVLLGIAYALWVLSALPVAAELGSIVRKGSARLEAAVLPE